MKRKYLVFIEILLVLISLGMIPLNMLLIKFSEWVVIIPIIGLVGISLVNFIKCKRVGRIALILITVLVVGITYIGSFSNPYWNSSVIRRNVNNNSYNKVLTYQEAKADLKEMMGYLKKCHPLFIHGISDDLKERYETALDNLKNIDQITSIDLEREIQLILVPIADAHTSTYPSFNDNLYLKDSVLLIHNGWKINKINDKKIEEIKTAAKQYICREVEDKIKIDFSSYSTLRLYNISKKVNTYEWINDKGEILLKDYTIDDFIEWNEYVKLYKEYYLDDKSEKQDSFVYYTVDEDKSLALLTLKSCNYNSQYRDCVREMFEKVKDKGIKNVAIDLRDNSGGNSMVANEIFRYLPIDEFKAAASDWRLGPFMLHMSGECKNKKVKDLTFYGKLYVLTNASSFSSAKDFAMMVVDNHFGILIGESPANSCYSYGDISYFNLTNSGIFLQVSTKKWYRADISNKNILVKPDIPCDGEDALQELYKKIIQNT